jgi:hypothetical protein
MHLRSCFVGGFFSYIPTFPKPKKEAQHTESPAHGHSLVEVCGFVNALGASASTAVLAFAW